MGRKAPRRGELFEIDLGDGRYAAAMALKHPLAMFFDVVFEEEIMPQAMDGMPVAFRCWVMDSAFGGAGWRRLGLLEPDPDWEDIEFVKRDVLSGAVTAHGHGVETSVTEAASMEPAAVWSGSHLIDRLKDHFNGTPNEWLESLRRTILSPRIAASGPNSNDPD
ncbi:hypothetical protein [Rhizobium hidalgonense]|uniref:hypothetical protein n=1 Tax=Rhizobium hidalgonense TaxID=1538159 RepID=UPI002871647D|nr:hypothetical protein [Rhizobium hidalgonense]MDR9806883.1 hypothetical protein [Rhizobium hidalgonense]